MKVLAISSLLLAVSLASGLNLPRPGNYTLKKKAAFHPRIAHGQNAAKYQFPYQVGLSIDAGRETKFCGGSLIANEWVLTAAHCVSGIKSVTVQLGMLTKSKPAVQRKVDKSKIILHFRYNGSPGRADIALIRIPHVDYTSEIQPIGLPRKFQHFLGTTAIASGWGRTSEQETTSSLQYATLEIISNSECSVHYGVDVINSGKICTGNTNYEVCKGDSGGPLLSTVTRTLIGIASLGIEGACGQGLPDVFTRVDYFLKWIREKTNLDL